MNRDLVIVVLIGILGGTGTYLLLPHRHGNRKPRNVHAVGAAIGGISLLLFASLWVVPESFLIASFFYVCAISTLVCAVAMVIARNPIHSALWFAAVVLSTTGLFVLADAPFLAVGTVIVYAGAIIVTFLFVIMLAQMEGRARYDRSARMPLRATIISFTLFLGLGWLLVQVQPGSAVLNRGPSPPLVPNSSRLVTGNGPNLGIDRVLASASRPSSQLTFEGGTRLKPHVAGLGETLYTDHLVTVELAGSILFAALVGALAIASPKPPIRPAVFVPHKADSSV